MFEFQHQKAIVTGASSGIGKATAIKLLQCGLSVVGIDKVQVSGLPYPIISTDLRDEADVAISVKAAAQKLGGLNVLVNVAGIKICAPLKEQNLEDFDQMFFINVRGAVLMARECLKFMPNDKQDGFRIVNVASELAYLGRQDASAYCATKGAILSLTRSWAREFGPYGRINAVAPGPIDTQLIGFDQMTPEQKKIEESNPLGRIGRPEEVADIIAFLVSSGAQFVSGHCYSVDGGAAMH